MKVRLSPRAQNQVDEMFRELHVDAENNARAMVVRGIQQITAPNGDASNLPADVVRNPMTTLGDLITGSNGGYPVRLGIGAAGYVLTVVSGVAAWALAKMRLRVNSTGTVFSRSTTNYIPGANISIAAVDDAVNDEVDLTISSGAGTVAFSGDISPAQITADQNNYDPTDLATASTLRLTSNAAWNITGLAGGADGRLLLIHNTGSFPITLKDESASSTTTNRFALAADIVLATDQGVLIQYDSLSARWRQVGGSGGGSTSPTTTRGDIIKRGASVDERLGVGTVNQVLTAQDIGAGVIEPRWAAAGVANGHVIQEDGVDLTGRPSLNFRTGLLATDDVAGVTHVDGFANPMTALGDLITGNVTGAPLRLPNGTEGYQLRARASGGPQWEAEHLSIPFVIDGQGAAIGVGVKGEIVVTFPGQIEEVTILGDQVGSILLDILKCDYAGYPTMTTICGGAPPQISSAAKMQDSVLTGWSKGLAAGEILRFTVTSVNVIQRASVALKVRRT